MAKRKDDKHRHDNAEVVATEGMADRRDLSSATPAEGNHNAPQPHAEGVPTPAVCDRICAGIADGLRPERAAALAGVRKQTFDEWLEKADEGLEPFSTFAKAIDHADAKLQSGVMKPLLAALPDNPPTALRFLERRWPREYSDAAGRAEVGEVPVFGGGPNGGGLQIFINLGVFNKPEPDDVVDVTPKPPDKDPNPALN